MDSPLRRSVSSLESPYLRAQEATYAQSSSFSLGPALEMGGGGLDPRSPADTTSQGTAELTAFVQNLLQQMQTRFQTMSDAILVRIDEMARRIEDLERSVDDVLREVTAASGEEQVRLPSPTSSPIRRAAQIPASPDVRKYSLGPPGSQPPASPTLNRYTSMPSPKSSPLGDTRRQPGVSSLASSSGSYSSSAFSVPDNRRHSATSYMPPASPDLRRQTLPGGSTYNMGSTSPDVRKSLSSSFSNTPGSPDNRYRSDSLTR